MDFQLPAEASLLAERVRAFIDREVLPLEPQVTHDGIAPEALTSLRQKAREAGVYGPQIPTEYGGLGLPLTHLPPVFEAAGRSLLGPLALHCAAPDEGNMHTLELAANPSQRERYLRPLAEGRVRSAFAMTEPAPGAGSDPTALKTLARRDGDGWVLEGHKCFTTGADGAAFLIVMARTDPEVPVHKGSTLFLVDAGTPGLTVVRRIPVLGDHAPGGHCELRFEGLRVRPEAVLGGEAQGFRIAQRRLGPARLTHCMRWTGVAQRALEVATARARERHAFGGPLADKQAIQWMLADSHLELEMGRLLIHRAAWLLARGDEARLATSMAKVHVAESVHRVIDRAIQVLGGLGVSDDTPLAEFYREARAFRIYDGPSEVHRMVIARELLRG
ncbi:MAG: acyl-CoA dehydrogenase family protein [Deltaproteobacteria bacterium]|nr:acyl-CoA dehydrogenase family protein [Deltaproteobacteria bacterium]